MTQALNSSFSTLALALLMSLPAAAMASDDHKRDSDLVQQFSLISAERASEIAMKEIPGVVREIELDDRSNSKGWKWEVEVVNAEGREVEIDVDAKTGQVLKVDKKRF